MQEGSTKTNNKIVNRTKHENLEMYPKDLDASAWKT